MGVLNKQPGIAVPDTIVMIIAIVIVGIRFLARANIATVGNRIGVDDWLIVVALVFLHISV